MCSGQSKTLTSANLLVFSFQYNLLKGSIKLLMWTKFQNTVPSFLWFLEQNVIDLKFENTIDTNYFMFKLHWPYPQL